MEDYLSDKDEIMAYARSIIEIYRADGVLMDETEEILKTLNIAEYPNNILKHYLKILLWYLIWLKNIK